MAQEGKRKYEEEVKEYEEKYGKIEKKMRKKIEKVRKHSDIDKERGLDNQSSTCSNEISHEQVPED